MALFGDFGKVFSSAGESFGLGKEGGEDVLISALLMGAGAAAGGPVGAMVGGTLAGSIVGQRQQRRATQAAESAREQAQLDAQARENSLVQEQFRKRKATLSPGQNSASTQGTVLGAQADQATSILG